MSLTTVVSAPGKVLVAGGYLVLDPAYSGTVVSTSSRFYTIVRDDQAADTIVVRSPQFTNATWVYSVQGLRVEPHAQNTSSNKFVHLALQSTLSLVAEIKEITSLASGLEITIAGDNDFYSQRAKLESLLLPRLLSSLDKIPPFCPTGVSLSDVHKTGLGSSAALITSLTSALLLHLGAIPKEALDDVEHPGRRFAHNLAQYVHCRAQGKVGSGFDVSAAVFGSHIYTRFNPDVIQGLMGEESPTRLLPVLSPDNPAWDYKVGAFKLPPLTRLMLADVDAGSDTPSLVGKVLKWRKENPAAAQELWDEIDRLNQSLAKTLLLLSELYEKDKENYTDAVKYISSLQSVQWSANPLQPPEELPVIKAFSDAHKILERVRAEMKRMGQLAGVAIEPDEQTKLLDVCVAQAGVVGGGVPGAGGYDAAWLLVCNPESCHPDQSPVERVEHVWSNYEELSVSPLSSQESMAKGIRLENITSVPGLSNIL